MAAPNKTPKPKKRVRLAPEVRKQLILDAALVEFSTHGFGGSSTERIAQGAGLSQAGLYTHFNSKDEILAALLNDVLMPEWRLRLQEGATLDADALDALIDASYATIAQPKVLAIMRLLIAESARMPQLIEQWRYTMLAPFLAEQQRIADQRIDQGQIQRNPLTTHFQLVSSPIVHALLVHLIFGNDESGAQQEIQAIREAHRSLLKAFVAVPAPAEPTATSRKKPRSKTSPKACP